MAMDKAWRENNERLERIEKKLDTLLESGGFMLKPVQKETVKEEKRTPIVTKKGKS